MARFPADREGGPAVGFGGIAVAEVDLQAGEEDREPSGSEQEVTFSLTVAWVCLSVST